MKGLRDRAITSVIFDGGIEVVGDKFMILETKIVDHFLNCTLCGDCQYIDEGVIMVVTPIAQV